MQRLSDERGFALPMAIAMLVLLATVTAGIFLATTNDLPLAKADQNRRGALDAAQAGAAWYASKLAADPDFWTKCGNVPDPDGGSTPPVSGGVPYSGTGTDTRKFRTIPGSTAQYTIELLPANGYASCSTSTPAESMLASSRLRIRSTGIAGGRKRSLIVTFRRPSFLDYVYYTNYEALDPDADVNTGTTVDKCKLYYNGSPNRQGNGCTEIQWATGDVVAGPLHTNDQLNVNGSPVFGDQSSDRIEVSDPTVCRGTANCADPSNFKGQLLKGYKKIDRPPDNRSLEALTDPAYRFAGSTQFILGASSFRYRNAANYPSWTTKAYPANGLMWVTNTSGTCPASTIYQKYDFSDLACGNAYVSGTYGANLTLAASNDIIVTDDVKRVAGSTAMAGLVANNYVRLFHPVNFKTDATTCDTSDANSTVVPKYYGYDVIERGALPWTNPTIQAGILAVNHSWIVDNYPCGSPLGNLSVEGAIAQEFRGPVARSSGTSITSGYVKKYSYDRRFAYRQPPNFLDPVRAAWIQVRQNEQLPAT